MVSIDMPIPKECGYCCLCDVKYTDDDDPYSFVYCNPAEKFIAKSDDGTDKVVSMAIMRKPDWCPLINQEEVEPKIIDTANSKLYHSDMFKNYYCGNCGEFLHVVNRKDMFCSQCGRKVKWDD